MLAVPAVGVRCFKRAILGIALIKRQADQAAVGVAADRLVVLAGAKPGLCFAVCRFLCADVAGQREMRPLLEGGGLQARPQAAGADSLGLARVADLDQPRTTELNGGQEPVLLAGASQRGLLVDHGHVFAELNASALDRVVQRIGGIRGCVDCGAGELAREGLGGERGGAGHDQLPPLALVGASDRGQDGAFAGPGLPLDHHQATIRTRQFKRGPLLTGKRAANASQLAFGDSRLERHQLGGERERSRKSIQDLAGMRIVGDFDRTGQDAVVDQLVDLFADEAREPKVVDRRAEPVQGYRAVHVIVFPERLPLEIQVRTRRQHEWAELFEKLADRFGRGIRYGEPPTRLSARGLDGTQVIAIATAMADVINQVETAEAAPGPPELKTAFGRVDEVFANLRRLLELL